MNEFDKDIEREEPETQGTVSSPSVPTPCSEDAEASDQAVSVKEETSWISQQAEEEPAEDPLAVTEDEPAPMEGMTPGENYRSRGWIALLVIVAVCAALVGILIGSKAPAADPADQLMSACHSVVLVEVQGAESKGMGSGVILTADGYIATNHHVIEAATSITIFFTDGTTAVAEVVASSEPDDLALLKVDRHGLSAATFATEPCYVGQTVYAIGHPGSALLAWTTTGGIISYVNRELPVHDEMGNITGKRVLLQTDATVNPGNSGGALVNARGEVVGIITSRVETMKDAELEDKDEVTYRGLGFALPGQEALALLEAMMRDGHVNGVTSGIFFARPAMGITYGYVEKDEPYEVIGDKLYAGWGEAVPVSGIYVIHPADTDLQAGDIITHLDGHRLDEEELYESALLAYYPGDTVALTVYRNGETVEIRVVLGENT